MSKSEWFIIPDLEEFTKKARSIVYSNFGSWENDNYYEIMIDDLSDQEEEELNKVLTQEESLIIVAESVKREKNKKTQQIRYTLNDTIFADIIHKLNERMVSNILRGLVQKGLIETGFDSDSNDFVFWVKENNENKDEEKPETD